MMTVKELRKVLKNYSDEAFVRVIGGENEYGEWAELQVGDMVPDIWIDNRGQRVLDFIFEGTTIMEEDY